MRASRFLSLLLAVLSLPVAILLTILPAAAADVLVGTDAEAAVAPDEALMPAPTTVVYVFPTSPQSFVPLAGLPSFLIMRGAPLPRVATQVSYSVVVPAVAAPALGAPLVPGDLDCAQLPGPVLAPPPDPYKLDRDGDGIGCAPEDR